MSEPLDPALTQVDPGAGLRHLMAHAALILLFAVLTLTVSRLFVLPLGLCLGALFPLMHEATHRHVFAGPKANARLAFFCGAILLLPATWFRHFHQAHHRYTQDPARDPELATPRPATRAQYLWHLTGIPAWIASVRLLARQSFGFAKDDFLAARHETRVIAEARLIVTAHLILIALVVFLDANLFWVTYAPLLIGQIFLRFFLLAEHGGLPFVDQVMENTRTTRAAAWLRWLTWNMSYHTEHHANPAVPHDKLPRFHEALIPVTCPSYGAFHRAHWEELKTHETST